MRKSIYAIYDEKVKGVPGEIFTDFNDGTIIRGLQEKQKTNPISKEVAADLVLLNLGYFDFQKDIIDTEIASGTSVVGKLSDLLVFEDSCSS